MESEILSIVGDLGVFKSRKTLRQSIMFIDEIGNFFMGSE
jgi:hypothetical protein